jgi:acrylyl-CoA reductase (NADPH)
MKIPPRFKVLLLEEHGSNIHAGIKNVAAAELPENEVTVKVDCSTLNYKDALILAGIGHMVKQYPIVPGIDFAGTVVESKDPKFKPEDRVILTGWRHGELFWGGYAQYASTKAEYLIPCPANLTSRHAMGLGTAGLTAALALGEMEDQGLRPEDGPILVTGASGGVGSIAVALLAANGYHVVASTGKTQLHRYLKELGAKEIIDRKELAEAPRKLLEHEKWAGAIDSVGSTTLAHILGSAKSRSTIVACGLAGGGELSASLMPFLLRGIRLVGIASADCPMHLRERAWIRLAKELPLEKLEKTITECRIGEVYNLSSQMLQGLIQGRVVVDVNR